MADFRCTRIQEGLFGQLLIMYLIKLKGIVVLCSNPFNYIRVYKLLQLSFANIDRFCCFMIQLHCKIIR